MDFLDERQQEIVAEIEKCDRLLDAAARTRRLWNVAAVAITVAIGALLWPDESWLFWLYVPAMVIVLCGMWTLWLLIDYGEARRVRERLDAARDVYVDRLGRVLEYKREAEVDPQRAILLHAADILAAAPECVEVEIVRDRIRTTYTDGSIDFWKPEWAIRNRGRLFLSSRRGERPVSITGLTGQEAKRLDWGWADREAASTAVGIAKEKEIES